MEIGRKIHTLRKRAGMSQEELSFVLNVSRQTVSKWETNVMKPETDKIIMLCRIFDISADILLRDDVPLPNLVKQAVVESIIAYAVQDSVTKCAESNDIICDCKTENESSCLAIDNCINEVSKDDNCEALQTDYVYCEQTSLVDSIGYKKSRLAKSVLSMSKAVLCLGIAVWLIYQINGFIFKFYFDGILTTYIIQTDYNKTALLNILIKVILIVTLLLSFITVIVGEYIGRKKKRL